MPLAQNRKLVLLSSEYRHVELLYSWHYMDPMFIWEKFQYMNSNHEILSRSLLLFPVHIQVCLLQSIVFIDRLCWPNYLPFPGSTSSLFVRPVSSKWPTGVLASLKYTDYESELAVSTQYFWKKLLYGQCWFFFPEVRQEIILGLEHRLQGIRSDAVWSGHGKTSEA